MGETISHTSQAEEEQEHNMIYQGSNENIIFPNQNYYNYP